MGYRMPDGSTEKHPASALIAWQDHCSEIQRAANACRQQDDGIIADLKGKLDLAQRELAEMRRAIHSAREELERVT